MTEDRLKDFKRKLSAWLETEAGMAAIQKLKDIFAGKQEDKSDK
jgi:hypothetical protein